MKDQSMLTGMPRTTLPHPEQVETQWLITVKKGTGLEVEYHFEMRVIVLLGQLMVSFCEVFS